MRISTDFTDNYASSPPNSALSNTESYTSEASFCSTASSSWDSSASTMSSSPPDNSAMFPMTPVAMFEMEDHGMPYMTPVTNSMPNHSAAAEYEYNSMDGMYHPIVEVPELINNTPLPFYEHSSPLTATPPHGQGHFVVPSQTLHDIYNTSPCRPNNLAYESPLGASLSMNTSPSVKYFISPDGAPMTPSKHQVHQLKALPQSVLDASTALHRLDVSPRMRKTGKKSGSGCDVVHIPKSVYKCTFPGCSEKDGKPRRFKRQEHLKRHMRIHTGGAKKTCQFCSKGFDVERSDNYRQHLKLHAEPEKKGKRTRYNAEAKILLEQFQREKVEGRQAKLQEAISMKDKGLKREGQEESMASMTCN